MVFIMQLQVYGESSLVLPKIFSLVGQVKIFWAFECMPMSILLL